MWGSGPSINRSAKGKEPVITPVKVEEPVHEDEDEYEEEEDYEEEEELSDTDLLNKSIDKSVSDVKRGSGSVNFVPTPLPESILIEQKEKKVEDVLEDKKEVSFTPIPEESCVGDICEAHKDENVIAPTLTLEDILNVREIENLHYFDINKFSLGGAKAILGHAWENNCFSKSSEKKIRLGLCLFKQMLDSKERAYEYINYLHSIGMTEEKMFDFISHLEIANQEYRFIISRMYILLRNDLLLMK